MAKAAKNGNGKKKHVKPTFKTTQKKEPRGKPFEPGNRYGFKPGASGNPGGRPKLISGAYKLWLEQIDDETGLTHAQLVAQAQGQRAIIAYDTTAAKELRQATEGDTLKVFAEMSDDELDKFISERITDVQGTPSGGVDDSGATAQT